MKFKNCKSGVVIQNKGSKTGLSYIISQVDKKLRSVLVTCKISDEDFIKKPRRQGYIIFDVSPFRRVKKI